MGYKINIFDGIEWFNILTHDSLENIQGGDTNEHYHLTADQFSWIDQNVTIGSSPSFYNTNMSGDISIWNNDSNYITADDVTLNIFTQTTPSSGWTINHNFNSKFVLIQVYKDDDKQVYPKTVELIDNNNIYVEFHEEISGYAIYSKVSGTAPISSTGDHGSLTGLLSDDHTQYILVDGTRSFTGPVAGITPTTNNHLTTKQYVDNHTWIASNILDLDTAVSNNSDVSSCIIHKTSSGSDHIFIDQDVTIGSSPQFSNINMYGPISVWTNDEEYINSSDVTFENLNNNGDVGTSSTQVSRGNHTHHNIFFSLNASGDIDISNSWTDLTFDNQIVKDSYYTFTNNKEIEILQDGLYKIKYHVTTYVTNYSNDSDSLVKIVKDSGLGYSDLNGSLSGNFNGSSDDGLSSSSKEIVLSLNNNDKIKIQAQRLNGTSTIKTYPNSCTFQIEFLR